MELMKKTQRSFAGGVLDKDLMGRQDLKKYAEGCQELTNFKVRKQGNVIKRSGTDLICDFSGCIGTSNAVANAKLIPLIQERSVGFYILITAKRAFLVSPDGMRMSDGTWSRTPGATAYSIDVPFDDSDIRNLDWCQSGDTIFFAHRSYPPCRIVYSNGTLEYTKIEFRQGLGTPPKILKVEQLGDKWTGTGGLVHVEYAVTAVKDGVETGMSTPYATEYNAPWDASSSIRITIDTSSMEPDSWDCFYVYKKESDVFGLIGTTSNQIAFVSVLVEDFDLTGSLYPSWATEFNKIIHLRESGNKFGAVTYLDQYYHFKDTLQLVEGSGPKTKKFDSGEQRVPESATTDEGFYVVRSDLGDLSFWIVYYIENNLSPCKEGVSLDFSVGELKFDEFRVKIGCVEHHVKSLQYGEDENIQKESSFFPEKVSSVSYTVWSAEYTDFHASKAKHYTAKVEYYDESSSQWKWSSAFACASSVDQTNVGSEWISIQGSSFDFRLSYSQDEHIVSYDSASDVTAKMKEPGVSGSVIFKIPSEYRTKTIRKIKVSGYDSVGGSEIQFIANGICCYKSGTYIDTFTDDYITPDLTITPPKTEDHFVNPGEYPGCVQIYSQRLVYASSANNPFTFWMSQTGDIYNFDTHEYVRASDAITASTAALEMPRINRMLVHRDLMLFSEGGEWQVAPSTGNAVAPSTIAAKLQSVIGCASWLKPIPLDSDILFCDSSGEAIYATRYNFASDGYDSSNLSVLSQRLFRNNQIRSMAYVQFPESTLECVLADGTVASLVYMKEHEVCAWSRQAFGGDWKAVDVAVNKSVAGGSSHCAFVANRTYASGSSTVREWAILGLRDIDPNDNTLEGNLRMDAVRISTSEPTAGHGETVVKIGSSKWAVGCLFTARLKTTSPEFTEQETAQMEIKNATESEVRVIDGSDFTVYQPEVGSAKATVMKVGCTVDKTKETYSVETGDADCRLPLVGTNSRNGSIVIEHDSHLPLSILSVTTDYRIEYSNHAEGGSKSE